MYLAALTTIGSTLRWYDLLYLLFVYAFVRADDILDLISGLPGKPLTLPSAFTVKVAAMLGIAIWSIILWSLGVKFVWWHLFLSAGAALTGCAIRAAILHLFDFDKWGER